MCSFFSFITVLAVSPIALELFPMTIGQELHIHPCPVLLLKGFIDETYSRENNWNGTVYLDEWPDLTSHSLLLWLDAPAHVEIDKEIGRVYAATNKNFIITTFDSEPGLKSIELMVRGQPNAGFPDVDKMTLNGVNVCPNPIKLGRAVTECGKRMVQNQKQTKQDSASTASDWPWLSAIYHLTDSQPIYKCSGNLINSNTVITITRCMLNDNWFDDVNRIIVQLGRLDFSVAGPNMQEFRVRHIISHHGLSLDSDGMVLIRLAGEVTFTAFVQPICLSNERPIATDSDNDNDIIGQNGILVGFDDSNALRQEFVPVISRRECLDPDKSDFLLADISYCRGEKNKNGVYPDRSKCDGDLIGLVYCAGIRNDGTIHHYNYYNHFYNYGTGMYFEENGIYSLRGILTGIGRHPSGYTFLDVARHWRWIKDNGNSLVTPSAWNCGKRIVKHNRPITTGSPSEEGVWPWHAAIYHVEHFQSKYKCGGTLIDSRRVITAERCVRGSSGTTPANRIIIVQLGRHDLLSVGPNVQEFRAGDVTFLLEDSGIAIIHLATDVMFTAFVQPICLWSERGISSITTIYNEYTGKKGILVGWELNESAQLNSKVLTQAIVPTFDYFDCDIFLTPAKHPNLSYCAKIENVTIDVSGSGMYFEEDGIYVLRGVYPLLFHGLEDVSSYGPLSDVSSLTHWINVDAALTPRNTIDEGEANRLRNCGKRLVKHQELILNGFPSKPGDWPWHGAIYHVENRQHIYKCGGTLINSKTVITAAHCVIDINGQQIVPERIAVQLGKYTLSLAAGPNVQEFQALRIIVHKRFERNLLLHDIALIRLSTEATFNAYVQPICLWSDEHASFNDIVGVNGVAVGWGLTENNKLGDVLSQAFMPVVSDNVCLASDRDFFGSFISDLTFCAGFRNGTGTCNGDSGGGLYIERDGVYTLRGIISLTKALDGVQGLCHPMQYVLFTDAAQYLGWIRENSQ